MKLQLPFLLEPSELEQILGDPNLIIIDIGDFDLYEKERIPGAVHVDYLDIVSGNIPTSGTLPPTGQLKEVFSAIGLKRDKHVVAYDAEGNGRASRLLWTLDVLGHPQSSLLNGGYTAWKNEGHKTEKSTPKIPQRSDYPTFINCKAHADKGYIISKLGTQRLDYWTLELLWNMKDLMSVPCEADIFQALEI